MRLDKISYADTGYFSGLIADYLKQKPKLASFYKRFPNLESFQDQTRDKLKAYPKANRQVLSEVLQSQYTGIEASQETRANLQALSKPNAVTVVTGHQLNLFTGPLYFHYKIATALDLCRKLKEAYPEYEFVPVYWMASEDHDLEEINHFNFRGKEFRWNRETEGAVGRMDTGGLEAVANTFKQDLGPGDAADRLHSLFCEAYLQHDTLSEATRYLVNELFGETGLVIIDADDARLKSLFAGHMERDLLENLAYEEVRATAEKLQAADPDYPVQVTPREINLFYLYPGGRSRLIREGDTFGVLDTEFRFSREQLLETLRKEPENFSPNVITRPLYQEVILPNICYIGGGGELAYWFELQSYFEKSGVDFPILLLRNSALFISEKQQRKAEKLGLELRELFLPQNTLINKKIRQISNIDIDFSPQRKHLQEQFEELHELARLTDPSFLGAVKAQEKKQLNGLDHLEKRLLKAQKRKLKDHVDRLVDLQNDLFPEKGLQERNRNFSGLYLELGNAWVPELLSGLDSLDLRFTLFVYPQ